jgi:outer membrane lipoprotein-sorting protein
MNSLLPSRCFTSITAFGITALFCVALLFTCLIGSAAFSASAQSQSPAQSPDEAAVIRGVDAAVHHRVDSVAGYTVTENYNLFRGSDLSHPAAAMTVLTTYARESGKSYKILSEDGSHILRSAVFSPLLDNEMRINQPGNVEASWLISANYEMHLQPGGQQQVNGRECYALAIHPRQKAPNLIEGTLWVDTRDYTIVKIEGHGSRSASWITAPSQVTRVYEPIDGFAMATHAKAVTESDLLGPTTVTVDYSGYQIRRVPEH